MSAGHGLTEETVERIREVLASIPELDEAVLFGSRAKQTHKRGSDIDLALSGPRLDWRVVGKIDDMLDDLLLPYRFSLILRNRETDSDVEAHIARVGIPIFRRDHNEPECSRANFAPSGGTTRE